LFEISFQRTVTNFDIRELGWEDKESRIVVIKHLFHPSEAKEDTFKFFEELKNDIEIEAGRCGEIQTLRIFEVSITLKLNMSIYFQSGVTDLDLTRNFILE
jgi:hypothetical protein